MDSKQINLRAELTKSSKLLEAWFVAGWIAGIEAEIEKDCGEYWKLRIMSPEFSKPFWLPKTLAKIKNPPKGDTP